MARRRKSRAVIRPWRPRTVILASAVVNLFLLVAYDAARQSPDAAQAVRWITASILQTGPEQALGTGAEALPGQAGKSDLEAGEMRGKGPLKMTLARPAEAAPAPAGISLAEAEEPAAAPEMAVAENLTPQSSADGRAMAPLLSVDSRTGKLAISQFSSLTMAADDSQCLEMGYAILNDLGLHNDLLDVMAASDDITITKICASNGVMMFTCRNGGLVVSTRELRPGQSCT